MRGLFLAIALLICVAGHAADPLEMTAVPAFSGQSPGGTVPVIVTLRNRGAAVDARVVVRAEQWGESGREFIYPVNLPTGTVKRIITFPETAEYSNGPSVTLESRYADIKLDVAVNARGANIGYIGDDTGALSAVRQAIRVQQNRSPGYQPSEPYNDCYCLPEDAPDRAIGYSGLERLVIGEGAERMSPAQWNAIRQWTLSGGSVIFPGGASAAYLRVPGAAPLLPLRNLRGVVASGIHLQGSPVAVPSGNRMPGGRTPDNVPGPTGLSISGAVALTIGDPAPGADVLLAQNGRTLVSRRIVGAGAVLLLGFSPLEQPLRTNPALPALWNRWIAQSRPVVGADTISTMLQNRQAMLTSVPGGLPPAYRGGAVPPGYSPSVEVVNGAFDLKLPPVEYVIGIFCAYFVLAVPVTYLVLRRLRRLELAWFTGPALAVGFALVFYITTSELYLAGMARRTGGIIFADASTPAARFSGFTELFFPRGGSYAIAPPGAERLRAGEVVDDYYGHRNESPLTIVDNGTAAAPEFSVTNLSFRRINFDTPAQGFGAITATLKRDPHGNLQGTVRNGTTHALRGCTLIAGPGEVYDVANGGGDLAPGHTGGIYRLVAGGRPLPSNIGENLRSRETGQPFSTAILYAETGGEEFGPPIGRNAGGDRSVAVLVSLPVEVSR